MTSPSTAGTPSTFKGPTLRRELGLFSATALVISNMIGTGVFGAAGYLAGDLGHPDLMLATWIAGGLVALAGCLSYAELGVNFPRSGGEYVYIREAWGPMWGFLSGWISFFAGFAAPIAAGSLLFAEYLGHYYPALSSSDVAGAGTRLIRLGPTEIVALAVLGVFTLINILGVALAARVQNLLTTLKVAILAAFVVLAFLVGQGSWAHFTQPATRLSSLALPAQFAVSLVFVMYAYSGWNAAAYVAEEMRQPERTLPRALVAGTVVVALFYLALNASFIYALRPESLKGVIRVGAEAATALFGGRGGNLFTAILAACILSSVSAMVIVGPRVYFAMAQDGYFFRSAARVGPRTGAPTRAILYQSAASAVMIVSSHFEALAYYIGITLLFFAALAAAGLLRLRKRHDWNRLQAVSVLYPLIPVLFIAASVWMIAVTLWRRPAGPVWGLITLLAGALVYRWKFHGRVARLDGS